MTELERFKANLRKLKEAAAMYGMTVPIELSNQIDYHEEKIKELEKEQIRPRSKTTSNIPVTSELEEDDTLLYDTLIANYTLPKVLPWGLYGYLYYIFSVIVIIGIALNWPNLGGPLLIFVALLSALFITARYSLRHQSYIRLIVLKSIRRDWPKWKRKIDTELSQKGFVTIDDVQRLADSLGIQARGLFGIESSQLDLILQRYEDIHSKEVVYAYVYDKKSGKPIDYESPQQGVYYARKVLALRKKYHYGKFDYSSEQRTVRIQ